MRKKFYFIITIILFIILLPAGYKFFNPQLKITPQTQKAESKEKENQLSETKKVSIVSTKPDPLDNIIINSGQVIEINFSNPLENTGEFKHRITPAADYKLELTGDRKTLKIVPVKPYELGNEFTLVISPETKFDNGARMEHEAIYHFHTVAFRNL